jgi:methylmalonyl-CoA/ethylmalonyl-CoA epimerase
METILSDLAPYFGQISYVVSDAAAAQQWFKQVFGVKYFGVNDIVLGKEMNTKVHGRPAEFAIRLLLSRYGTNGELELELIQPLWGNGPHMEALQEKGPGLHHVAFFVPDFEKYAKLFLGSGCKWCSKGRLRTSTLPTSIAARARVPLSS